MTERRKSLRRGLHLPVQAKGHTRDGKPWEESCLTEDVSYGGVSLQLTHAAVLGEVLHLALPLPEMFRRYELKSLRYPVFVLVRNVSASGPPFRVGVMFLGRHPPRGFEANPGGLFFLPSDPKPAWAVARASPRHELLLTIKLRRLEEDPGATATEELTITEDISLGGSKVRTTLPLMKGNLVEIEEVGGVFHARALVQNVSIGADNIPRLHLQFMDDVSAAVKELLRRQGIASE